MSDEKSKDFAVDQKKDLFNDTEMAGGKYHLVKEDEFLQRAFSALLNDFFPEEREVDSKFNLTKSFIPKH